MKEIYVIPLNWWKTFDGFILMRWLTKSLNIQIKKNVQVKCLYEFQMRHQIRIQCMSLQTLHLWPVYSAEKIQTNAHFVAVLVVRLQFHDSVSILNSPIFCKIRKQSCYVIDRLMANYWVFIRFIVNNFCIKFFSYATSKDIHNTCYKIHFVHFITKNWVISTIRITWINSIVRLHAMSLRF